MRKSLKDIIILIVITSGLSILIWLPFYLKLDNLFGLNFNEGLNTIYRNYDGLEYVMIAKTFYQPTLFANLPQSLPASYFAAHFPGYALLMIPFAYLLGYLKSMILVSTLFTIASVLGFYFLVKNFKLSDHPLLLSAIFLILPARWLIVHTVGSAEPMFIFFTIMVFYFVMKFEESKKWMFVWLAGLFGILAQFTRPPGILIFVSLGLYVLFKIIIGKDKNIFKRSFEGFVNYFPLILIPITLLSVFYWYFLAYGDFFAYFHSGDNIHLVFPPFQVFNINQFWVGEIWLEDIIYIFILGFLAAFMLIKRRLYPLGFFVLSYLGASTLVAHRDVSRYVLPIFPFALIAYEKALTSKEFKIVLVVVALATYLYAQNFIINNTAPFPDPYLFN